MEEKERLRQGDESKGLHVRVRVGRGALNLSESEYEETGMLISAIVFTHTSFTSSDSNDTRQ